MKSLHCVSLCLLVASHGPAVAQDDWKKAVPNAWAVQKTYASKQITRLAAHKFDELDKEMAATSLAEAEDLGLTPSVVPYSSFTYSEWEKKPSWEPFFKDLDAWVAASPKSPYCRLAKSSALIDYAWAARGGGFADTVKEEGWKLFGERLIESLRQLGEAKNVGGEKEPVYWTNLLTLCRGLQAPPEKTKDIIEEALKRFPENPSIYYRYCIGILPRWGGAEGEWQAWIDAQNKDARWGGKEMDPMLYARILWQVFGYIRNKDGPFFQNKKLSWEKAKLGVDQLCEKYPKSIYWKSARAYWAWSAQDAKAFEAAMTALNGTYDSWAIRASEFQNILNSIRKK